MTALTSDAWDLETVSLRVGLVGTGMLLFDVGFKLWHQGEPFRSPWGLGLLLLANVVGLALMTLALVRWAPAQMHWLALAGVILVSLMRVYAFRSEFRPAGPVRTDTGMITEYAVEGLTRGQNPYTWNFGDFLRVYRASPLYVTPHLDGTVQNRAAYPGMTYWLFWGTKRLGLSVADTTFICLLLMLILLFLATPVRWRPLILLPLAMFEEYTHFALVGNQDVIFSLFLVCMLVVWSRPTWRAAFFGLACGFRQQAWLVAPFLLIHIWKTMAGTMAERRRQIAHLIAVSAGLFLVINLPFILWDPRAWWLGVFEHSYVPFNVYSHGLGALSQYGFLPLPRQWFTVMQMSSLVAMGVIHWRHPRVVGQAFWVFPALFFWLYYRGLTNYWVYWIPPLALALVNHSLRNIALEEQSFESSSCWVGTVALAAPLLVITMIWGVALSRRHLPIDVDYSLPLEVISHSNILAKRVRVTVANRSDADFVPRFAVQRDPGIQGLPWRIDDGPEVLRPGQEGEYVIDAGIPDRAFPVERGGQIVVTDARGDYWRRQVRTIPPDPTFVEPDLIANPSFSFWLDGKDTPISWSLQVADKMTTSLGLEPVDGKDALVFEVSPMSRDAGNDELATARLVQSVVLPNELRAWVYPTEPSVEPLQPSYGFEFDDGEHKLWVLFGNSDTYAKLDRNFGYIYFPAPVRTWSQHVIRLQELYDLFEWQLPEPSIQHRNGLEYRTRQTELSLISPSGSSGIFGPIEQKRAIAKAEKFWTEMVAHPNRYYLQRGNEYRRQRNYDLAQEAYRRAIIYDPTNAEAYFGLAEASFWRDDWQEALGAFEKCIAYGCQQPALAYRGMGWSHYGLGEFTLAERAFGKAAHIDPGLADAYNGLGWVALQEQRCDSAVVHFGRALALDPDFFDARRGLKRCEQVLEGD